MQWKVYTILKLVLSILILLVLGLKVEAQQVPLSQYYVSPLNMNPALVGCSTRPFISFHHRSQWNSFSNSYPINIASIVYPIVQKYPKKTYKGGVGLQLIREVAGMQGWLKNTGVHFAGAYNLPLDYKYKHVISLGVGAAYTQKNIQAEGLKWGSQYDQEHGYSSDITPSISLDQTRLGYFSAEAGIVWTYNTFKNRLLSPWQAQSGISVSNINRPNVSFTNSEEVIPMLLKWYAGVSYSKNNWKLHPQTLVMWRGKSYHFNFGAYAQYRVSYSDYKGSSTNLIGGLWYRWNDALAVSGGIQHHNIQIALSMDLSSHPTIDYLSTGQAWEASVVYTILNKKQNVGRRFTPLI